MAELPEIVTQLAQQLKAQRLIKIFVGDQTEPYEVQQSVLENACEYFVKAIKNEHLGVGNIGTLRFQNDSKDAWQLLLYFIVRGRLPEDLDLRDDSGQMLLISCWVLGDRYFLPDFQDLVMVKVLNILAFDVPDWETIRFALDNTCSGSKLRRAFADTAISYVYSDSSTVDDVHADDAAELEDLMGVSGAVVEILAARDRLEKNKFSWVCPFNEATVSNPLAGEWQDYMVGEVTFSSRSAGYMFELVNAD
ncbi:hypothetical protein CLAFUW4_11838 [Fulvia fulva]|uniref:Uncharacterized protein n=1 Tax=Passalora fulva TaxID=5499 RepID=A0A9Q8PEG5_PASFU|nr:uncharacterized protein CLAFUR5_10880 [Fulvia fulva]KAK4617566.1 hypothetical protein CLAFUR4_11843 [Fulvia fulva]KAK4619285.1 hypothetical protein CLAFUR0_11856 [Fulvia fulva]UJO20917.1 hypothetical protein CLAFUR5_10880 [Fulvia fulva]WPV18239.1 hypothetical protein CLAFUW4_11838 [Fulvia fulva]WPV33080.1 hypothetical protein CLAFUW7_11845 [Fulvia fulva]